MKFMNRLIKLGAYGRVGRVFCFIGSFSWFGYQMVHARSVVSAERTLSEHPWKNIQADRWGRVAVPGMVRLTCIITSYIALCVFLVEEIALG